MDHRTYSIIELVGVSEYSYDDAARRAIARASDTLEGLGWFKVKELRGLIRNGEVAEYQVSLELGFRLLREDEQGQAPVVRTDGPRLTTRVRVRKPWRRHATYRHLECEFAACASGDAGALADPGRP